MLRPRGFDFAGLSAWIVVLAVSWFYFWTAVPEWRPGLVSAGNTCYYNLLTRGVMKGHLYLDLRADPRLAAMANPWDPAAHAPVGMHDASYYRGHYYLYFGAVPVFVLFLPFRLLTGRFIDESLASPAFATAGLALSVLLLLAVRRRHFPRAGAAWTAAAAAGLGLANLMPVLLRRPSVWEVPITCGYACVMAALGALYLSWHRPSGARWLALASGLFGLAVGSRPTYLLGCAALLVPLAHEARARRLGLSAWRDPAWRRLAFAAVAPLAACGVLLALYNWGRFGDPLNFGFRYLLSGEDTAHERLFSWSFLAYNLRVYALAPAGWSRYFPFVLAARVPPPPAGLVSVEDPFGVLPNLPFTLLALIAALLAWRWLASGRERLGAFCLASFLVAAGAGFTVSSFCGSINRYMEDFLPTLVVLAAIGALALAARGSRAAAAGVGALLAYSGAFDVLASLRHNELMRVEHPALYARLSHFLNGPSHAWDRWRKSAYGPVEMEVVFPRDRAGAIEPLVATGYSFLADYLFVHYLGADQVRFGLEHTSRGTFVGEAVAVDYGRPHRVRIDMGSLYPPAAHPYFDRLTPAEAKLRQGMLRVTLDGKVALERRLSFYDPVSPFPSIGSSGERPGFRQPFSGRILSVRRLGDAALAASAASFGALRLELSFPPFAGVRSEPLLSTGETGRGDLLFVRYDRPDAVSFGYDHWSVGGDTSPSVPIDPKAVQLVEIDAAPLHAGDGEDGTVGRGRLTVRLNGRAVLDEAVPYYRCEPYTVAVGINLIQSSTAVATFSGNLLAVHRTDER